MPEHSEPAPVAHHTAEVALRGPAPRRRARVHWPAPADHAPTLVILFADPPPREPGDTLVRQLVEDCGAVVLEAVAAHAVEAHAIVAWAADHAAELGADPSRLILVGEGAGAAPAERVAELALDEGWPPLRHVALLWPHGDRAATLHELFSALRTAARWSR